jgi:Ni,Fe-hydrogenase III small subunit
VDHNPKIDLFGEVGVMMKYPSIDVIKKLEGLNSEDINVIFDVIADSIDFIYEGEKIHYAKEQKKDDLVQFLGNLTSEQFLNIQKFFQTMPRLKKDIQYTCPICQKEHFKVLEGLQSFF